MRKILTEIVSVLTMTSLIVPFSVVAASPIGFAFKDKDDIILYDEPTVATAPVIVDAEPIMPMDVQEKIAGEPMDSTVTTATATAVVTTTTATTTATTKSENEQLKEKVAKLEKENKALKEENEKLKKEKESLKELIQKIKTAFGL